MICAEDCWRLNSPCFPMIGMVINLSLIVGVYIPIIRIPVIKGGARVYPQYKELIDSTQQHIYIYYGFTLFACNFGSRLETASLEANREEKLKLLGPLTAELGFVAGRLFSCVGKGVSTPQFASMGRVRSVYLPGPKRKTICKPTKWKKSGKLTSWGW